MNKIGIVAAFALLLISTIAHAQDCAGGSLMTHEAYQYGRFETRMQSAPGDGVVSSFFLYNWDLGCNWPAENNEIDIEMTGNRDDSVQCTTHHPGLWSVTEIVPTPFDPHAGMHEYAIEWTPGVVRWFFDDELVYMQSDSLVEDLIYPMRIFMNLWAADIPDWVGVWDPSVLPVESSYDYVRYYSYTPGNGDSGTDNDFRFEWSDEFDTPLDATRWDVTDLFGFGGNYCTFVSNNVMTAGGKLELHMTEPLNPTFSLVHFSVDATALNLALTDTIYLNGTLNGWCGTCNPMTDLNDDNIWEIYLMLPAGVHEYLYTKNGWEEIGYAPLGGSCDFSPCDEWANYGVTVQYGSGPIETETYCWASCDSCAVDIDDDGVADALDNCIDIANSDQRDTNNDGFGNLCDPDLNNDLIVNFRDLTIMSDMFFGSDADADFNDDGLVNFADLGVMRDFFFLPPGPSGLVP